MSHPVVVAMAARNSLGNGIAPIAAAIRAGVSRVQQHDRLVDALGEPLLAAFCEDLEPASAAARMEDLAARTLADLRREIGDGCAGEPPVLVALPSTRRGFDEQDAAAFVARLKIRAHNSDVGPSLGDVRGIRLDHAGGLAAIAQGVALARSHPSGMCIVGGVESSLDAKTQAGRLLELDLPLDGRGRVPTGEGACFLLVATGSARHAFDGSPLATVLGTGVETEAASGPDDELLGISLNNAIRAAISSAPAGDPVRRVVTDINAERWRSEDWGFAILRTATLFENPSGAEMPAGQWGDLGAATGPSLAMLAAQGWARNHARGDRCLLLCSSRSGHRSAVLLGRP